MPKPKGKVGPPRSHGKNPKRRPAPEPADDYIPESIIGRGPDEDEPEDDDSTSLRIKIDVPVAMWVCKTALQAVLYNLPREIRISGIAIRNVAPGRNSLVLG
jgi:hypothetical protein